MDTPYPHYLDSLLEFLRIPSVSTLSSHRADMDRAAQWVADRLAEAGFSEARLIREGEGHPLVYAERLGNPESPTILIYGHYDVQPPDPLDQWETPPFQPTIRDASIYARGATDDKGQLAVHLFALRELARQWGVAKEDTWPLSIRVLVEGEEECGGAAVERWLARHAAEIPTDAVIISDTCFVGPEQPSIDYSLRGILYTEIRVRGPKRDLHSGVYGGAVLNPLNALAGLLAGMIDLETGKVCIPGFYDDVEPLTDMDRRLAADVPFSEKAFLGAAGLSTAWGEAGFSTYDRVSARPTLDIHGIVGGFQDEGAKTVIPSRAATKVSMRLVPRQDPGKIFSSFEAYVRKNLPSGLNVEIVNLHGAEGVKMDPSSPFHLAAAEALGEAFGAKTVFVRSGGSIPISRLFASLLKAQVVFMGLGLPDDGPHAPNEKFSLRNFSLGIRAAQSFYRKVAAGFAKR